MRKDIQQKIDNSRQTQINLNNMDITNQEIEEIIMEIKKVRPKCDSLFLKSNKIDDVGASLLGKNLQDLHYLSFIDLQFNQISIKGAHDVLSLILTHPDIDVALHGNKISNVLEIEKIQQYYEVQSQTQFSP
jgi:hypothetical protein